MLTVDEVLRDRVSLDLTCVDRVLLNGYVKDLQLPGGVIRFIREQKQWPIPSPAMLGTVSEAFRVAVERFAAAQGLEVVTCAKGENKEAVAQAHLARFPGTHGVVLIGKAQEKASASKGRRTDKGSKVWFTSTRCSVQVTHYSFYLLDEDFGLVFIKICTYLPFEVKVCFNGHEWAKQQLRKAGIAFEPLENGFASCADPARLQALCATLTGATVQALFDRWVGTLPWPLGAAERAAGYRHQLSVWQLEVSRTQVFVDAEQGRALVEALIRENLDLGRPDRVRLLFGRPVTVRTPGTFFTQVMQHGVLPSIRVHYKHSALKQYLKEGQALRTEAVMNNPGDFGSPRGLAHFDALVALGHVLNERLLAMERLSQDCFVPLEAVRPLGQSTVDAQGRRAPALRFGDPRVMAVLAAVAQHAHLPAGLANKTLRPHVAALLGLPLSTYSSARMSYDLRRLRLKGLVRRRPKSHTYVLTTPGVRVAVFYTKLYARCFRPGLAALVPDQPRPAPLAQALSAVAAAIHSLVEEAQFAPAAA